MRFSGGSEPQSLRDSAEGKSSALYLNHLEHLCIVRFFHWFGLEEIHDIPLVRTSHMGPTICQMPEKLDYFFFQEITWTIL